MDHRPIVEGHGQEAEDEADEMFRACGSVDH